MDTKIQFNFAHIHAFIQYPIDPFEPQILDT